MPVEGAIVGRKIVARDGTVDAHVIKLGSHRPEAGFDIPQALTIGQVRKIHHPEMFGASEGLTL